MFAISDGRRIEQNIGLIMKFNFFAVCFETRSTVSGIIGNLFISTNPHNMFPNSVVQAVYQSGISGTLGFPSFTIAINGSYYARNGRLCVGICCVVYIPPVKIELQVIDLGKAEYDIDRSILVAVRLTVTL